MHPVCMFFDAFSNARFQLFPLPLLSIGTRGCTVTASVPIWHTGAGPRSPPVYIWAHVPACHAAACPNRWHLCIPVLLKDSPAQGTKLIALCECHLKHWKACTWLFALLSLHLHVYLKDSTTYCEVQYYVCKEKIWNVSNRVMFGHHHSCRSLLPPLLPLLTATTCVILSRVVLENITAITSAMILGVVVSLEILLPPHSQWY